MTKAQELVHPCHQENDEPHEERFASSMDTARACRNQKQKCWKSARKSKERQQGPRWKGRDGHERLGSSPIARDKDLHPKGHGTDATNKCLRMTVAEDSKESHEKNAMLNTLRYENDERCKVVGAVAGRQGAKPRIAAQFGDRG